MSITERPPRALGTTNTSLAVAERLIALLDQPTEVRIRELARLCRQLSHQYQEAQEACLARSWWRLFNQAGICLREALDQAKVEEYRGLGDEEIEQAYFLLIHVAYFFAPGGIAEAVWPTLSAEPGDQQVRPPAGEALGLSFAPLPQVSAGGRMRQQVGRCFQRLGHILGKGAARARGGAGLLARPDQGPPGLEEAAQPYSPRDKEAPDGTYPGR
jgi:hypothetical protein